MIHFYVHEDFGEKRSRRFPPELTPVRAASTREEAARGHPRSSIKCGRESREASLVVGSLTPRCAPEPKLVGRFRLFPADCA